MRRTELDLCRIFACLLILMIHAAADIYHELPPAGAPFFAVVFLSTLSRSGLPLFFMISGALLLSRERMEPKQVLIHRVVRLTGMFYLWSLFYALGRAASGAFEGPYDFLYAVVAGHYHLWFLPAMAVVCMFMPVVHAAIHRGGLDGRYILGLFFFLGIFLANCNLTPDPAPILYRFTQNFSLDYLPYLGYSVWGWYLSKREYSGRTLRTAPLVFLAVTLAASIANRWYSLYKNTADGWLFHFFSLPTFLQSTAAYCFFLALKGRAFRHVKPVTELSACTLGVYLLHPLMISVLQRAGLAPTPAAPVSSLLVFYLALAASCFALTYVLRRVPLVKRLF